MASIYLDTVIGDGLTPQSAYRPSTLPSGSTSSVVVLMCHEGKRRCLVLHSDDTLDNPPQTRRLLSAPTLSALRVSAATTNPTAAQRAAVRGWLTSNGFDDLTLDLLTWWQIIHFVARQVNPSADLGAAGWAGG